MHPPNGVMSAIVPAYYEADGDHRRDGEVFSQFQSPGTAHKVRTGRHFASWGLLTSSKRSVLVPKRERPERGKEQKKSSLGIGSAKLGFDTIPGLVLRTISDQMNAELLEKSRRDWERRLETERKDFDLKLFNISQGLQKSNQRVANRFTAVMLVLTLVQVWLAMGKSHAFPFRTMGMGTV